MKLAIVSTLLNLVNCFLLFHMIRAATVKLELNFNSFDWSCANDNLAFIEQL